MKAIGVSTNLRKAESLESSLTAHPSHINNVNVAVDISFSLLVVFPCHYSKILYVIEAYLYNSRR